MAKLSVLLIACFFVPFSFAINELEAFNFDIRERLHLFNNLQKEPDGDRYADELNKLVEVYKRALKAKSLDEKDQILSVGSSNLSSEFDSWLIRKVEETELDGISDYVQNNIALQQSLLQNHAEHDADMQNSMKTLEHFLKEADFKQKKNNFSSLGSTFSGDFKTFMLEQHLKAKVAFFEKLLEDKNIKFAKEIQELKAKTEAALADNVSIDDKRKVFYDVLVTGNKELDEFLHNKSIEY